MFFGEGAVRVLRTLPSGDRYESPTRKTMMFLGAARIRWMLLPEFHEGKNVRARENISSVSCHSMIKIILSPLDLLFLRGAFIFVLNAVFIYFCQK